VSLFSLKKKNLCEASQVRSSTHRLATAVRALSWTASWRDDNISASDDIAVRVLRMATLFSAGMEVSQQTHQAKLLVGRKDTLEGEVGKGMSSESLNLGIW